MSHSLPVLPVVNERSEEPADDPAVLQYRLKTQVREIAARLRAVWDVLRGTEARHYGDPIPFPPAADTTQP